jgi:hypothetical protein
VPLGIPRGARCVQRFDDSLNSAIHITYRISLRSSSMREPRDPLLKVVLIARQRKQNEDILRDVYKGCLCEKREPPRGGKPTRWCTKGVRWISRKRTPFRACNDPFESATALGAPLTLFVTIMILPQVHLRKPCYDFYFL